MRRFLFFLFTSSLLATGISPAQQNIIAKFVARAQPYWGGLLPYRLFVPEPYDSTRLYPIVLTLHGSGERGSDNLAQISGYRIATTWADSVNQARNPCFVVSPQCPVSSNWSALTNVLNDLLDSLSREFAIDPNQVIVTGLSMGGYGTWEMISLYPNKFSAAIPMSGGGDPGSVSTFSQVAIWDFHGALDNDVNVSQSRDMMSAIEASGRPIVYTDGHGSDYRGLPDSVIAAAVRSHDDVFYTEYQFGSHVIWNQAYDDPSLHAWVFDHYRRTPGGVTLHGLDANPVLTGAHTLSWTGGGTGDSVEIWWSSDAGSSWTPITTGAPNSGAFLWNTTSVPDCGLGLLKVLLRDPHGHCYALAQSGYLRIDNPGDGQPTVHILPGSPLYSAQPVTQDSVPLHFLAEDPENATLTTTVEYSLDTGRTFQVAPSTELFDNAAGYGITVHLQSLPNSSHAMIRIRCSDGAGSGIDQSVLFIKQTPRGTGATPSAIVGGSAGIVNAHVVDASQLTGHTYRLTFADSAGTKWYDVEDKTLGTLVVPRADLFDGSTEGPLFDGLRLTINDPRYAVVDTRGSRWTVGSSTQTFNIFSPSIDFDTVSLQGYRNPADYTIALADHVVDTSVSSLLGLPAVPLRFSIRNITEGRMVDVGFLDNDGNGVLSDQDEIYLLEPDSAGSLRLTWGMTYSAPQYSVPPVAGDEYTFLTQKPIRGGDTYEFNGVMVSAHQLPQVTDQYRLEQNYPNPFNPSTTIEYMVAGAGGQGLGVREVRIVIYDVLGRKVAVLVDARQSPGTYQVRFDGSRLASGVYFYRMTIGSFSAVRKMILVR